MHGKKQLLPQFQKNLNSDPHIPLNYRGISILSCVGKMYSSILNNRIKTYLEELKLLSESQNGFRAKRSCEEHVFVITSIIRNRQNDNLDTFAAFIDMQKAFDSVDRKLLLFNLICYNVDGNFYKNLKQIYSETKACVKINGLLTDWFSTHSGVLQGDVLSPVLFNSFIDGLAVKLNESNAGIKISDYHISNLMYADDIALLANSATQLQLLLNIVANWCNKWRLGINQTKTNIVHFRKIRKNRTTFKFSLGSSELKIVNSYKYLGLILSEFLNYNIAVDLLAESAGRALGAIIGKFKNYRDAGFKSYTKLFHSGVVPILDYMSGIWGFGNYKQCDRIQNRALQFYLGVNKYTPELGIASEAGWTLPFYRRCICMLKLWNRLLALDESRLPKIILNWDIAKYNNNFSTDIECIADMIDLQELVFTKSNCDISAAKDILLTLMSNEWLKKANLKPKLRHYVTFKKDFSTAHYLNSYIPKYRRALFTQLRLGVLPLEIETGRYHSIPLDDRICKLCNNGVEDPIHFICLCPTYNTYRNVLFQCCNELNENFDNLDNNEKFIYIMNSEKLTKLITMYIQNCWNYRKSVLFN